MESTPQVHLTLILIGQYVLPNQHSPTLNTSFAISIFSATFGMAKLLKNGPIKALRKNCKIVGYGQPGFILIMVIVAGNMIGKGVWLGHGFNADDKIDIMWIWALACILPQILLVN